MKDYKISELITLGNVAVAFFENKLGYTRVSFQDVTLRPRGNHVLYFSLEDDFQEEIAYDKRFKSESMLSIELEDFWAILEAWPNREQRELEIMARKLATLDANLDQIQSAQVLAFVSRLQPQIDEIRRMITHVPEEVDSESETVTWPGPHSHLSQPEGVRPLDSADDDEIPF